MPPELGERNKSAGRARARGVDKPISLPQRHLLLLRLLRCSRICLSRSRSGDTALRTCCIYTRDRPTFPALQGRPHRSRFERFRVDSRLPRLNGSLSAGRSMGLRRAEGATCGHVPMYISRPRIDSLLAVRVLCVGCDEIVVGRISCLPPLLLIRSRRVIYVARAWCFSGYNVFICSVIRYLSVGVIVIPEEELNDCF